MSIETNNINEKVKALAIHIAQKMGELKAKVDQYDDIEIAGLAELRSKTNGIIDSLGLEDNGSGGYVFSPERTGAIAEAVAAKIIKPTYRTEIVEEAKTDEAGFLVDANGQQLLDAEGNPTKDPEAVADPSQIVYEQKETIVEETIADEDKDSVSYSAKKIDELLDSQSEAVDEVEAQVEKLANLLGIDTNVETLDWDTALEGVQSIQDAISSLQTALASTVTVNGEDIGTVGELLAAVTNNKTAIDAEVERATAAEADLQDSIDVLNTADDYSLLFDVYYETGLSGDITEVTPDDVAETYTNAESQVINISGVENPVIVDLNTGSNTLKVSA